jgi:DNA-binding CsgD family transcriptional regulator
MDGTQPPFRSTHETEWPPLLFCCCCFPFSFSYPLRKQTTATKGALVLSGSVPPVERGLRTEETRKQAQMHKRTPASGEKQQDAATDAPYLSQREIEILALVADGRTDNEIAIRLCMSAKTVSWYVKEIRARLNARSRAHAVALAMWQGILSGEHSPDVHS